MKNEFFVSHARRRCGRYSCRYGNGRRNADFATSRSLSKRRTNHGAVCKSRRVFAVGCGVFAVACKERFSEEKQSAFLSCSGDCNLRRLLVFAVETSGELLKKLFGGFLVALALFSFIGKTVKNIDIGNALIDMGENPFNVA